MGSVVLCWVWAKLKHERIQAWPLACPVPQGALDANQHLLEAQELNLPKPPSGLSIGKGISLEMQYSFSEAFHNTFTMVVISNFSCDF